MALESSLLPNAMQIRSILMCSCAVVLMLGEGGHRTFKEEQAIGGNRGRICTRV